MLAVLLSKSITIPPNTPEAAPVSAVIIHTGRTMITGTIHFPDGCVNAVGVRILDEGQLLAPSAGWIYGNDINIRWADRRRLSDAGRIIIQGISAAEDWPHTPVIYLEIV